ncbi:hypothetical protein GJ654_11730 [Rhodoblastus acidophilus]|uniref:GtrA/DPMS transmembrane domain-containing protein n=2 Tax=Rhodoblastus acidophilus TaxID=1074 RepID=A0A6N8DM53_RHOAC|nr:hypothetical protein [Rhodoblastus acidophilus]
MVERAAQLPEPCLASVLGAQSRPAGILLRHSVPAGRARGNRSCGARRLLRGLAALVAAGCASRCGHPSLFRVARRTSRLGEAALMGRRRLRAVLRARGGLPDADILFDPGPGGVCRGRFCSVLSGLPDRQDSACFRARMVSEIDRAGNDRVIGGFRCGPRAAALPEFRAVERRGHAWIGRAALHSLLRFRQVRDGPAAKERRGETRPRDCRSRPHHALARHTARLDHALLRHQRLQPDHGGASTGARSVDELPDAGLERTALAASRARRRRARRDRRRRRPVVLARPSGAALAQGCGGGAMTPARTAKEKAIGLIRRLAQVRVLRFLVVGGLNTAFGYGLYYALLRLSGSAMFALTLGTVLNVLFNFMTTGALVFRRMEGHRLVRYLGVYVLVYLYNAAGLILLLAVKVDPALAGLLLLPGAVVLSYLLNRSFVFNARPGAGHEKTHA